MVRSLESVDLVIAGPTASGKSHLALALAHTMDAEIISADSRQIYREISVGTGKLRPEEREGILHHLLDCCSLTESYSAGDFVREARKAILAIRGRGKRIILCGGTGLYLEALLKGLVELPSRPPGHYAAFRERLREVPESELYARLVSIDTERAGQIHPNDRFRLLRALYLWEEFSLAPSDLYDRFRAQGIGWGAIIGLDPGQEMRLKRISDRVHSMFGKGWIEEVEALLAKGYSPEAPGFDSLGYRDVIAFLEGRISRTDLLERVILKTRQYAKRQMTWFRHMEGIRWVDPGGEGFPLDLSSKYGTIKRISC
ncbi:MAG: tRNA (adenosine(37)-N6)-dimethylallyltransferase MiaA [Nitrospirae bacterium]|nr:tRNA (adenosine(37)-N6)-dimethylallyltransferase MiaA [Nitrospirota bacterium]